MNTQEYISALKSAINLPDEGANERAIAICEELLQKLPERPGAYNLLAQIFMKQEKLTQAERILIQGSAHSGDQLLHLNLGVVQTHLKKYQEAVAIFEKVAMKNMPPKYLFYHGRALVGIGSIPAAIAKYQSCLRAKPNHKAALNNLANLMQQSGKIHASIQYYRELIKYYPQEAIAYCNLGSLYERHNQSDEARKLYEQALKKDSSQSIIYFNLAQLHARSNDHNTALTVIERGLEIGDHTFRKGLRLYQILYQKIVVDWSTYTEDVRELKEILEEYLDESSTLPFEIVPYSLSHVDIDPLTYRKVAEKYAGSLEGKVRRTYPNVSYDHTLSKGKLKIGYISPNFRRHPGGILVRNLFDFHDSKKFEVHAFALVHTDDSINKDVQESVDYYHDISDLGTLEISDLINRTGIDILVSLAGYNANMNMEVMALRPAPIQMMMLGSHETSGASFIDYIFSDESMMDATIRENFSEQVITLPCSSLLNCELPLDPSISTERKDHALPCDKFVFASFNHPRKLDPDTFDAWMQILSEVPDSVLWLYDGGSEQARQTLLDRVRLDKISTERIIFAKPVSAQSYWERLRHADLFLDCFVYNAHVTGVEALRMGLPMITLRGNNHNSRLGTSLLHYSGLKNCATFTKNDYIQTSILMATNPEQIQSLKEKLLSKEKNLLFDTELQVKYLEKAYQKAILKFRKGLPPKDFSVGSALQMNLLM